jgi:hypothetical protein
MGIGMVLLALWLILHGLSAVLPLGGSPMGVIMAVLAIVAGILILVGR